MFLRVKLLLILILSWCYSCMLSAQNKGFELVNFTADDGLSQNSIYTIARTAEGFMWFGTNDGLNRFDGTNFQHFKITTDDSITRSNVVLSLWPYHDGLLVGTDQELLFFNPKTAIYSHVTKVLPGLDVADKMGIKYLFKDSKNHIWILTIDHGILKYNPMTNSTSHFFQDKDVRSKVTGITECNGVIYVSTEQSFFQFNSTFEQVNITYPSKDINMRVLSVVKDKLWLAINGIGILIYDPKSETVQDFKDIYKGSQYPKDVTYIYPEDNTVWVGTRSMGLLKIDTDGRNFFNYKAGDNRNSLGRDFVLSIFGDNQDRIWVGQSGGGVARLTEINTIMELFRPSGRDGSNMQDPMVLGMLDAKNDTYYFGTLYGGLLFYDRKSGKYKYFKDEKLPVESKNIYGMTQVGQTIWMATWAGLCSFNMVTNLFNYYPDNVYGIGTELYSILKISDGSALLVSGTKGMLLFNLESRLWSACPDTAGVLKQKILVVRYMQESKNGDVYMSGMEDNFYMYNYLKGTFRFFPHLSKYGTSRCFYEEKNKLWIASDNGLIETQKPRFNVEKIWTKKSGLANDFIYAVTGDKEKNIWVSTNNGLSRIDALTNKITNFTKRDGIQDIEYNSSVVLKNQSGELVFGGVNGVNFIPLTVNDKSHLVSMPQIIKINVLNKPFGSDTSFSYLKQIQLNHNQNFVDLTFISPNASHQEGIQYFYRLDGVDATWVEAEGRSFVSYTQLAPGVYRFYLKAMDRMGNESAVNSQLSIHIKTPYYATIWFRLFIISLLATAIFLLIKYRINILKREALSEKTIAQLEMKALQSQMNPHFVFNCINGIYEMIISNENDNARKYLNDFAILMRMTLENSKKTMISLEHTISYLEKYLGIEKLRMIDFNYSILVAPEIEMTKSFFPPMILQPLVENSIWHGLAPLKSKKSVAIHIYISGDHIVCEIEDNGIGINLSREKNKHASHNSTGLESIKEHIVLLNDKYNLKIKMDIYDKSTLDPKGEGTMVRLNMKYDWNDY
ncbi:MAG: histidine kinase [Saprospiraceae bacterium]